VGESGDLHLLGSVFMAIGLALVGIPFLLQFRPGGYRKTFAGILPERQKILRAQVQEQRVDSPQDGDEVWAMAELMRGGGCVDLRHSAPDPGRVGVSAALPGRRRGSMIHKSPTW